LVRSGGGGGVLVGDDNGESNEGPRSTTVAVSDKAAPGGTP